MMKTTINILLTATLCFSTSSALAKTSLPSYVGDPAQLGRGVQRTMTLLATSTPQRQDMLRIPVYGQSITAQD